MQLLRRPPGCDAAVKMDFLPFFSTVSLVAIRSSMIRRAWFMGDLKVGAKRRNNPAKQIDEDASARFSSINPSTLLNSP
jgi:hypothetical protein